MKEKKIFSIGEVAKMVGVEIHTIRFWTEEFAEYIKFELGKGDRRYYPEEAIKMFTKINSLIHHDGIRIKIIKEKKLLLGNLNTKNDILEIKQLLSDAIRLLKRAEGY